MTPPRQHSPGGDASNVIQIGTAETNGGGGRPIPWKMWACILSLLVGGSGAGFGARNLAASPTREDLAAVRAEVASVRADRTADAVNVARLQGEVTSSLSRIDGRLDRIQRLLEEHAFSTTQPRRRTP